MKSANQNLIIACGYGYEPEVLEPLLRSIEENCASSDVLLFYHRNDREALDKLRSYHHDVEVALPPDHKIRQMIDHSMIWRFKGRTRTLILMVLRQVFGVLYRHDPVPAERKLDQLHLGIFHVSLARYFWARQHLMENAGSVRRVMLCDTRDVVVQRDPFRELENDGLWTGVEDKTIAGSDANSKWIEDLYGKKALEQMKQEKIVCSGVSLGYKQHILNYLTVLCGEIVSKTRTVAFAKAYDQGIHNWTVRRNKITIGKLLNNGGSMLATLFYCNLDTLVIKDEGDVLDHGGNLVCILHQYDRRPELEAMLMEKYTVQEGSGANEGS